MSSKAHNVIVLTAYSQEKKLRDSGVQNYLVFNHGDLRLEVSQEDLERVIAYTSSMKERGAPEGDDVERRVHPDTEEVYSRTALLEAVEKAHKAHKAAAEEVREELEEDQLWSGDDTDEWGNEQI